MRGVIDTRAIEEPMWTQHFAEMAGRAWYLASCCSVGMWTAAAAGRRCLMARMSRVEVFASDDIAIEHVMNGTACRCWLPGDDPVTGRNYDHREVRIDEQLDSSGSVFRD